MRRLRPVVAIDGFLDADLIADDTVRATLDHGQFTPEILEIVSKRSRSGDALAYGSGFEARPDLLDRLRASVHVLGNAPDVVRLCSDPFRLSKRLASLGLRGPETLNRPPENRENWLVKRKGRSGGHHVQPASQVSGRSSSLCWQRECAGEPHSALLLAGDGKARIVGISRSLASESPDAPYAWSGAIGPIRVKPEVIEQVQWAARVLARDLNLLGLCGIDFIIDSKKEAHVVDVNPRLVATCELYAERFISDYMSAHVETCRSGDPDEHLLPDVKRRGGTWGMRVVYAPCATMAMDSWIWPKGTSDLPIPGSRVEVGRPLCTVRGRFSSVDEARAGLRALRQQVLARLRPASPHQNSSRSSHP